MMLSEKQMKCLIIEVVTIIGTGIYALFSHAFAQNLEDVTLNNPNLQENIHSNLNTAGYANHLRGVGSSLLCIIVVTAIILFVLKKDDAIALIITFSNLLYFVFYIIYLWDPIIATFVISICAAFVTFFCLLNAND